MVRRASIGMIVAILGITGALAAYPAGAKPGSRHDGKQLAAALKKCKKDKPRSKRKKCQKTAKAMYKLKAETGGRKGTGTGTGTGAGTETDTTGATGTTQQVQPARRLGAAATRYRLPSGESRRTRHYSRRANRGRLQAKVQGRVNLNREGPAAGEERRAYPVGMKSQCCAGLTVPC